MTQDSAPEHQQYAGEEEWEAYDEQAIGLGPFSARYGVRMAPRYVMMVPGYGTHSKEVRDRILADHAAARLARKLEEALEDCAEAIDLMILACPLDEDGTAHILQRAARAKAAALLSATGKEEAG